MNGKMRRFLFSSVLVLFVLLSAAGTLRADIDVTDKVELVKSRLAYDRQNQTSYCNVSVRNISADILFGPIVVVIDYINDPNVTIVNYDGVNGDGKSYFVYHKQQGELQPGNSTDSHAWVFYNPDRRRFEFSASVWTFNALAATFDMPTTESLTVPFEIPAQAIVSGGMSPYRCTWDLENDGFIDEHGQIVYLYYEDFGTHNMVLNVTDSAGSSVEISQIVIIGQDYAEIDITTDGGVAGLKNGVQVNIPKNTFTEDITLVIAPTDVIPGDGSVPLVGDVYDIFVIGSQSPNREVEIIIPYDPVGLSAEEQNNIAIQVWDTNSLCWTQVDTYIDMGNQNAHGFVNHFSSYSLSFWECWGCSDADRELYVARKIINQSLSKIKSKKEKKKLIRAMGDIHYNTTIENFKTALKQIDSLRGEGLDIDDERIKKIKEFISNHDDTITYYNDYWESGTNKERYLNAVDASLLSMEALDEFVNIVSGKFIEGLITNSSTFSFGEIVHSGIEFIKPGLSFGDNFNAAYSIKNCFFPASIYGKSVFGKTILKGMEDLKPRLGFVPSLLDFEMPQFCANLDDGDYAATYNIFKPVDPENNPYSWEWKYDLNAKGGFNKKLIYPSEGVYAFVFSFKGSPDEDKSRYDYAGICMTSGKRIIAFTYVKDPFQPITNQYDRQWYSLFIPENAFSGLESNADGQVELTITYLLYEGDSVDILNKAVSVPCKFKDYDGDGYEINDDCDDSDPSIYPGAPELCDGKDNDCDSVIDEGCNIDIYSFVENIDLDYEPMGIALSPDGQYLVATYYENADKIAIIRLSDGYKRVVNVGSLPNEAVFSRDSSRIYVTNYYGPTVSVINTATGSVIKTISGTFGGGATDIALHPDGDFLYVCDYNYSGKQVVRISTSDNSISGTIPVKSTCPLNVVFGPDGSNRAYVVLYNDKSVEIIDTSTHSVIDNISLSAFGSGRTPGLVLTPDGKYLYVTDIDNQKIWVIDVQSKSKVGEIPIRLPRPWFINMSPDGNHIFVTSYYTLYSSGSLSVIDTSTNQVVQEIDINPRGIATSNDGSTLYVANYSDKKISVYSKNVSNLSGKSVFNSDGKATLSDFNFFANSWMRTDCRGENDWCNGFDFNHDGKVDKADFDALKMNWMK